MMLLVDARSAVPPFEQVRLQLIELIRAGELRPDDRLPTVRKLASDLGVAPNTVARTYKELERDGIVQTRGRHGTFVSGDPDPVQSQAAQAAAVFLERMRSLGISADGAIALLRHLDVDGSTEAEPRTP
ncbi:GntR family transcriptional regulator [Plantibacter sp. YIM 135249]|uniref:GntR family transcriptional regulator n=1 Tax=Plantibacter sp. YIM 135249 TaxID=3423918 RepID=UPI003D334DDF